MRTALYICAFAAAFFLVCFLILRLDSVLKNNHENETIHKKQNSLNIAFENPMTVEAVSRQLEIFSKNNPECQINLFCAQKPEILKQLESNKLDFAFLNNSDSEPDEKYCCVRFLLKQNVVICSRNYLSVKPLNSCVQVPTEVIWKKNEDKANINSFASIIKSLGEKEE